MPLDVGVKRTGSTQGEKIRQRCPAYFLCL
jgi:hypothetical protein